MILNRTTGTGFWKQGPGGFILLTHAPEECEGRLCDVHDRRGAGAQVHWPLNWRTDRGIMEVICPHGIGHPTPAQVQYMMSMEYTGNDRPIHGCDGCCSPKNGWPIYDEIHGWIPGPEQKDTKMKTLYVAGPMTSIPEWNFPAFHAAAKKLRDAGYHVIDPAELDVNEGFSPSTKKEDLSPSMLNDFMLRDLTLILTQADGVATLPGSQTSKGAQAEMAAARAVGKPVQSVEAWLVEAKG